MASVGTRDHDQIRRWAEARAARPVRVPGPGAMLRFEFDPPPGLAVLGWDEFFRMFDERGLELLYDDTPGSRFHKLAFPEARPAPAESTRPPRMALQPTRPARSSARRKAAPKPAAARKRAARRARTPVRLAGGSAAGRVTTRSAKAGKPAGKSTRKAASQRPSPSRRAA